MLRSNELTPLVAAGVPLQRLAVPILVTGAVLTGLWLANREFLLPEYAHKIARSRDDLVGTRERSVDFARDDNDAVLVARRISLNEGRLEGVVIHVPAAGGNFVIQADAAMYDPHAETWLLDVGRLIRESQAGGPRREIVREPIAEFPFGLTPSELVLRESSRWAELLSLRQMNALLRSRNLPNLAVVEMNRHIWLTQPLLQLLLLALTLPFFLTREPGNVLVAGGRALALGAAFFAVTFFAHSMVATDHAALVAWIPLLVFSPVAVVQFANVKT
jgi:lipopolysaccharide export LptBFGC system permease protein LptF